MIAAALRHKASFSITARQDKAVRAAISSIAQDAWTAIKYTDAVFDEQQQRQVSDAEVAETSYTAFTSRPKAQHVTARLIVRRVKDLNPAVRRAPAGGGHDQRDRRQDRDHPLEPVTGACRAALPMTAAGPPPNDRTAQEHPAGACRLARRSRLPSWR